MKIISLAATITTVFLAATAQAGPRVVDGVAALVNDEMITLSDVDERAAPEIARLEQEGQATAERRQDARRHALDELISDRLLAVEEKNANIEVADQEIDFAVDDVRKRNNMDAATFEQALRASGQSLEAFRQKMKRDLAGMKLIGMKVRAKIKVSDEDVKAEYAQQAKTNESDVEVHARHIVIQVPKNAGKEADDSAHRRALDLAKRARSGEDFAALAKKYSESPSKNEGGDVGFFKRGEMVAAFDQVAFTLKPGEVSDPVRSPSGWHVIQVLERRAGKVKPFEQVREELRDKLWREQMQRHTDQYVADLRRQASVEIKIPELKP